MTTYAELDARLQGRCKTSRKIANNTYLKRRGEDIAVLLHATDVVTFHPDDSVTLDTGGWYTMTTKDRMNSVLGYRVSSAGGRWVVAVKKKEQYSEWSDEVWWTWDWDDVVPFANGMTIHSDGTITGGVDPDEVAAQDVANRNTRNKIKSWMKAITPDDVLYAFDHSGGDCWLCTMGSTDCLADHLEERYLHYTLVRRALENAKYSDPDAVVRFIYGDAQYGRVSDMLTRSLAKYLRKHLLVGAVATR